MVFIHPHNSVVRLPTHGKNSLARSAQFLRVSRTVYEEGRQILYGENEIALCRDTRIRGSYCSEEWTEVGWKDIRRFLSCIGPINISYIRKLDLTITDGPVSAYRHDDIRDQRRSIQDDHLMECLRLLGEHGRFQSVNLSIKTSRIVSCDDTRLITALSKIKTDKLYRQGKYPHTEDTRHYYHRTRDVYGTVSIVISDLLEEEMVREVKLYPTPCLKEKTKSNARKMA